MALSIAYSKNEQQGSIKQSTDNQYDACLRNSRKRFKTLLGAQRHMKKNGYELQSNFHAIHSKDFTVTCMNALHIPTAAELGFYQAQIYNHHDGAWHKGKTRLVTLDELIWLNHRNMSTRAVMLLECDPQGRMLPEHTQNDPLFSGLIRIE